MTNLAYSYCEETSFFDPCSFETNFNTLDHVVLPYDLYDLDDNAFDTHLLDCTTPDDKELYGSGLDDIFGLEDVGVNMLSPLPSPANLRMMRSMFKESPASNNHNGGSNSNLPTLLPAVDSSFFYDPLDLKNILSPTPCSLDIKMGGQQQQQTFDLSQLLMHFEQHLDGEKDDFRRTEDILNFQRDLDNYLTSPRPVAKPSAAPNSDNADPGIVVKNQSRFPRRVTNISDSSRSRCSNGGLCSSLSSSPLDYSPGQLMVSSPSSLCPLSNAATVFDFSDLFLHDAYQDLPLQNALLHQSSKHIAPANGIKKEKCKAPAPKPSQNSNGNNNETDTQSNSLQAPLGSHHMDDHDYCRYYPAHTLPDKTEGCPAPVETNGSGVKKSLPTILPKRGSGNQLSLSQIAPKNNNANSQRDSASPITLSLPPRSANQRPLRLVSLLATTPSIHVTNPIPIITPVVGKDSQSRRRKRQISLNNATPSQRPSASQQQQYQQRQQTLGLAKKCKPTIVTATNERGEVRILAQSNMPPVQQNSLNLALPRTRVISAGIAPLPPTPGLPHSSVVKEEFDPEAAFLPRTTSVSPLLPKLRGDVDNFIEDVAGQELDNDFLAFLLTKEEEGLPSPPPINTSTIQSASRDVPLVSTITSHRPADKLASSPLSRSKDSNSTPITTMITRTTTSSKKAKTSCKEFTTKTVDCSKSVLRDPKKELPPCCTSPPLFSSWNDMTTLVDLNLKRVETATAQPPPSTKNSLKSAPSHPTTVRNHSASSSKSATNLRHHTNRPSPQKATPNFVNTDASTKGDQECGWVKVNGISDTLGLGDVKSLFKKFGPIKNVVINACTTNRYAIVTYHNKRDALTAVRRGNHIAGNNKFEVSMHTPRENQSSRHLLPITSAISEVKNNESNQRIGKSKPILITPEPSRSITAPNPSRTLRSCRNENSPSTVLLLCS